MPILKKRSTPGIYKTETDISNLVTPVGTSTGATVVRAIKGPINRPVLISSEKQYVDIFGEPLYTSGTSFNESEIPELGWGQYGALIFLEESDSLYVVRDYDTDDKYAATIYESAGGTTSASTSGIDASSDPNKADKVDEIYSLDNANIAGKSLLVGAIGPGEDGNNIAVTLTTFSSTCDWFNKYDDYTSATDTSAHPIESKVFKIDVYTKGDNENWSSISYSGTSASPVETWYGTRTSQKDANNNELAIEEVVNGNSDYIYVKAGDTAIETGVTPSAFDELGGGALAKGTNESSTDGWSYLENREDVPNINILICPTFNMTVKKEVEGIASSRKDCIAVAQTGDIDDETVASIKTAETWGYSDPSYIALYAGYDKYYDQYNDKYVYVPKCLYGASLFARNDARANVWDAPMGVNRGILTSNGQKRMFTGAEIGQLYDANINTSKNLRGYGNVMWGQKTAQKKASALDRINVRRELLFIENSVEQALIPFIGEPNNESTRLRVTSIIDDFMATLEGAGAFDDSFGPGYQVVCNTTNNTPQIIDSNKLQVSIYVKPVRVIEFIELETVVTRSGIEFKEIIG